jgi:hypothetical protein
MAYAKVPNYFGIHRDCGGLLSIENKHIRVAPVRYMYGHRQGVAVGGDADFLRIYYLPADFVR